MSLPNQEGIWKTKPGWIGNRVALVRKRNGMPESQGGRRHGAVSVALIGLHKQILLLIKGCESPVWAHAAVGIPLDT